MQVLVPVMRECFQQCSFYGCKYVSFPPLGVGRLYNYPPDAVARCMVDEIIRQTQTRFLFKVSFADIQMQYIHNIL